MQVGSRPNSSRGRPATAFSAVLRISACFVVDGAPMKKPDVGRVEFTLYPAVPQLNGKYTQHVGTMGQVTWHVREHFGLTLSGGGNWYNQESRLNAELVDKARVEAQWASSLLWTWTAMAGVEVAPFSGEFALFDSGLATFSVVINAGLGVGGTRHLLKPERGREDRTSAREAMEALVIWRASAKPSAWYAAPSLHPRRPRR